MEVRLDKKGIIRLGFVGIALVIVGFFVFFSVFSSAVISKDKYLLGEQVKIDLEGLSNYEVKVVTPSTSYVQQGSDESIVFKPEEIGNYRIIIDLESGQEVHEFEVLEEIQESEEKSEIVLEDLDENLADNEIERSGEIDIEEAIISEKIISDKKKEVVILSSAELEERAKIVRVSLPEKVRHKQLIEVYSLELNEKVDFDAFDDDNDGLFDGVEWDAFPKSENQTFEVSIKVLNVQSYPVVGGSWTVEFVTTGRADLRVRGFNGTTWSQFDEKNPDLIFLDIKCGDEVVSSKLIDDSVLVNGYECDEIGFETSQVITSGKHFLEFRFGNETAYAFNDAGDYQAFGETGEVNITGNQSVYINFQNTYSSDPVVVISPVSHTAGDDNFLSPQIYSLNQTGFNVSMCRDVGDIYCNRTTVAESLHYFVFDSDFSYPSWIAVGTVSSVSTNGDTASTINYGKTFSNAPGVWVTAQTYSQGGNISASGWVSTPGTSSTSLYGCVHQAPITGTNVNDCESGMPSETFGWVAIDTANANFSNAVDFQGGAVNVNGPTWSALSGWTASYTTPRLMVTINGDSGAQDPKFAWGRDIYTATPDVRMCEQDGTNDCDSHNTNPADWFTMEDGVISIGEDNSPPGVMIIDPADGEAYNSVPVAFNVSTDEVATVFYSLDGGLNNISMTTNASETGFTASNNSIADGYYNFSVYANDSLGNNNFTESAEFIFDSATPIWFDLNTSNSTPDVGSSVSFWSYWNDSLSGLDSWIFSWNATISGEFENITSGNFFGMTNISNTTQVIPGVASGKDIGYRFFANDSAGNLNLTAIGVISVQQPPDSESPMINSLNVTPETSGYGQNFSIQANVTDNIVVFLVQANITYPNGSTTLLDLGSIGGDIYESDFADSWQWGDYSFNVFANDSAGNSNTSLASGNFYVRANATISLQTESDIYGANQDVELSGGSTGEWIYDSWEYRLPITVTENSGDSLTDFQVNLSVDTRSLVDSGKMQASCQDIRFGDQNGSNLFYWVESGCNTTSTSIWVNMNLTNSESKGIHMYYGNPVASSESNENNTLFVTGEAGILEVAGSDIAVNLQKNYTNPRVFAVPRLGAGVSRTGAATAQHHLITGITSDDFDIRQVEDATSSPAGVDNTNVSYIVLEQGRYFIGLRNLDVVVNVTNTDESYTTSNFGITFASTPAVLADTQTTNNGIDDVYARGENLGTSSIQLQTEGDSSTTPSLSSSETIAYAAILPGTDSLNTLESARTGAAQVSANFVAETHALSYSDPPVVVAQIMDENGANAFYAVTRDITTTDYERAGEEPFFEDGSHGSQEDLGWVTVPSGFILGTKYASQYPSASAGTEEERTNILENIGSTNISGYMLMQIRRNSTDAFISTQVDDANTATQRAVTSGSVLSLSSIWNSNPWDTDSESAGYYKVVAWLTDPSGNFLVNDTGGNITNEYVFFLDITPPTWSNFGANESSADPLQSVLFNATWDDNGALDRWEFWWNATGTWDNVRNGTFSTTPGDSATVEQIPSAAEASNFSFYFRAYDTTGASNQTANGSLFVNDFTAPSISNEQIVPSSMNRNDAGQISADVTDNEAVESVWARVGIPNGTLENASMPFISGTLYRVNYQSTEIGEYNATVFANDTSGNENSGSTLVTWDVFGRANVNLDSPSGGSFALGSIISTQCSVQDSDTSGYVANYPVNFYGAGNFLGQNFTNSSGQAIFGINTTGYAQGVNALNCTIADNSSLYYNANIDEDDVSVSILYPQVDVFGLDHENSYEIGLEEYEAGDLLEAVNVTVNNTGGAAAFGVNVTLRFNDINGDATSWSENEVQTCGDLNAGETCQIDFTNSSLEYAIGQSESSGDYSFNITVEWFGDGSGVSYNSSFDFFLHQPQNNFSSSLTPTKVVQNDSAIYNFTVVNPWGAGLTGVNVTLTCPNENITCSCLGTNNLTCDLSSISAGGSATASFNLTTNSSTNPADYLVNATVRYIDPSSEFTQWDEKQNQELQVRGPTPFRVNMTEFSVNVTRGSEYNLSGFVNNTGVVSVNDVYLIWTIPTGWENLTGNLTEFNQTIGAGIIIENNVSVNLTSISPLGEQEVELKANSTDVSDDFQTESVFVYSNSFITFVSSNNSNPLRNESIILESLIEYDNGTGVDGAELDFYLGGILIGSNTTNSTGSAVLSGLVPLSLSLGSNSINITHSGSSSIWTNPSFNNSETLNIGDQILIENISASPLTVSYGQIVTVGANISSMVALDSVRANVTYPNGSNTFVQMSFSSGERYEGNFTDSWQWGDYSYTIIANNTPGFSNESLSNQFFVRANLSLSAVTDKDSYFQDEDVLLSGSEWWNASWSYKQSFNISNNYSEDLYEYQIELSVDVANLFNSGKLRNDCGDIRFTWYNSTLSSEEEINHYSDNCNVSLTNTTFWVQVPYISMIEDREIYMYYGNDNASSMSNIESTFSYSEPRVVGYVVTDRMDNGNGGIISLANSNTIQVGASSFSLGDRGTSSVTASSLAQGNNVSATSLFHIDSNVDATDMVSPVSWADTEFYYYLGRGTDTLSIVSPFGNATVRIYDAGSEISGSPFSVNKTDPQTITASITDDQVVRVSSDIPVLVERHDSTQDSYTFYPATTDYLYGLPSTTFQIGAGPNGAEVDWFTNGTGTGGTTLGANSGFQATSLPGSGSVDAYRVNGSEPISAMQQADGDGTESTTFMPFKELGTRFGSFYATEYIAVAAPLAGTSCTTYNSGGSPLDTQTASSSADEVHKLCFGCGSSTQYTSGGWTMNCTQPVYTYYEEDSTGDETNLWSWKQMRQYVHPEPVVSFESEKQVSSVVNNNFTASVYLIMEVQTNSSGSWETLNTQINDTNGGSARTISNGDFLDLMSVYNPVAWNTALNSTGHYRIYISLTDQRGVLLRNDDGSLLNTSAFFGIEDVVPPEIVLIYPSNGTNFANTFLVPNFTFSVTEDLIDSCQLYGDWNSGWHENQSLASPLADGTPVNFSGVNVGSSGFYFWNVRCNDTSGNIGWEDFNFTFSAFLSPDRPNLINISQDENDGTGNVTLFWEATNHSYLYRIYQTSDLTNSFNLLGETFDLNFTDTNFSDNIRRFYRIDAYNPTGQNESFDYFGAHVYSLEHNGNTRNWLGFPTNASYLANANDSLNEIRNSTAFTMWNETTQTRVTCNSFSCPTFPACTDTNCNFALERGRGYETNLNSSVSDPINWSLAGIVYNPTTVNLVKNLTDFGKNWISLYANTSLGNAQSILENISNSDATTNWDEAGQTSQGLIPNPLPVGPPYLGTNFNTEIEKGYEVSVTQDTNWTQV